MHYGVEGKVLYGMRIEAIQDRLGDDISIGAKLTSKFRGNLCWI